ncbi:SusC/RagA family TonB-linked outer membrane protein [Bacteroides sp.]
MKRNLMLLLGYLFIGIGLVTAQTQKVTGVVISEDDKLPVLGASVKVKGTTVGTVTDIDGHFSLDVPESAKLLQISYIGMQTVDIPVQPEIKVILKSDTQLVDEVVIVGYGSAKKLGSVVGSVATVNKEKIANRPVANVGDALQGQVAGLQVMTPSGEPSGTVTMRLRGVSSINSNTEPLFILDGSPISSNAFTSLNPNDIENMTVLKDASSTAIYGSRAANGVVILTSKKGKMAQKARVTVKAQYGWSQMTGDNIKMMNAEQWLNLQELLDPSKLYDAAFQKQKKFQIDNNLSTDWSDVFFGKSAPTQQYDVNVVGGSEAVNYYLSFAHYDADGIMDDSSLRRETLRTNVEVKITDWLKAGVNLNIAFQKYNTTTFGSEANSVYNKAYAARIYRPDQSLYEILTDADGNFIGYGEKLNYFDKLKYYNPYYLSDLQPNNRNLVRLNGNTFFNINPIKGLNIRAAQAVEAFDYRNSFKAYPKGPFEGEGKVTESFERYYSFTFTNTAEYKFNLGTKHHFSALLGQESIITQNENFSAKATKMINPRMMLMTSAADSEIPDHSKYDKVFNSYFATVSYNYGERYYFDLSGRRDGSSLFAKNNRWANFYSVGVMWNMKKEQFLQDVSWLSSLQLKASYGTTGNSGITPYNALALVSGGTQYDGKPGIAPSTVGNDELTWETMKTLNIGFNAHFFDRFSVELEYYNRNTSDMLMAYPISLTTGHGSSVENVASMRNRGFDLTLGVDILNLNDFTWGVTGNINYNKNEITKLFNGLNEYTLTGSGLKMQVGKPWGEYYYVKWAGVDPRDGYNMWYDKNGNLTKEYSEEDAVFVGKQQYAPWSGGFGTTFSWKGISASADFSFMLGQYMLNNERYFTENPTFASNNNQTVEMLTIWQKPGDRTNISIPDSPMQFDTHLLENASFMRLKNLSIAYTFPSKWMRKTNVISDAKIYFVGRNLLTVTKYKGYDPEVDSNIQLGNYPNTKQYTFGIELTF